MSLLSCPVSESYPSWGLTDLAIWKLVSPRFGGGRDYIQQYKNGWVRYNRLRIKSAALTNNLPPELLAGTCWIEVGGDPNFIDRVAFEVRSFDWSGPEEIDEKVITSHPTKTSFGAVSVQLRTAADTLGLDVTNMSTKELRMLAKCLQKDRFNIDIVAKHLRQLINHDGFQKSLPDLSKEQIKIVGARYNRGIGLSLASIKKNTSYGDFIVKRWSHLSSLLNY